MYTYRAFVIKVYDADTITVIIDLGFKMSFETSLRLSRINAPEMRGPEKVEGKISRDRLRELVLGKKITVKTNKDKTGKYGRYIADIYVDGVDECLNDLLVTEGLAVYKDY